MRGNRLLRHVLRKEETERLVMEMYVEGKMDGKRNNKKKGGGCNSEYDGAGVSEEDTIEFNGSRGLGWSKPNS